MAIVSITCPSPLEQPYGDDMSIITANKFIMLEAFKMYFIMSCQSNTKTFSSEHSSERIDNHLIKENPE